MPERFIKIVSIGPTDIVLWIKDKKYDFSAPQDVIKRFLWLQRTNQGKAIAYLRDHCTNSWNVTEGSKEILSYKTEKKFEVGARVSLNLESFPQGKWSRGGGVPLRDGDTGTIINAFSFTDRWNNYPAWWVKLDRSDIAVREIDVFERHLRLI
jgi:hypothetical protein